MKRVLCLFLVVLMLLSTLTVFVSAASESTPSVMTDLEGLQIDGKAFSESDFPLDSKKKTLQIIAAAEYKFRTVSDSPDFNLFFYVYNPSGMKLTESARNSIQIAMSEDCQESYFFGFKIYSKSSDYRFLKIGVISSASHSSPSLLLSKQTDAAKRVYSVPTLRFVVNGKLESFSINRAYIFEGSDENDTLQCSWKELGLLGDVILHATNWISPNAGLKVDGETEASVYDHYELHTVYFRVPEEYWNTYEYLYSIHATYDAVHLTPIIVTRENDEDFADQEGQDTKNAILAGTKIVENGDLDIYDLVWVGWDLDGETRLNVYSEYSGVATRYQALYGVTPKKYDTLSYYFATLPSDFEYTEGADIAKAAVSQKQLGEYFYERYGNPLYKDSDLYVQYISNQDLSKSATEFKADGIYKMSDYQEILNTKSAWDRWWTESLTENDSPLYDTFANEVEHITVLKDPGAYANVPEQKIEDVAEEFFISEADMDEFSAVCKEAAAAGDYVVLLRIGFNDYSCAPVKDVWELYGTGTGPYVACAVDKWAYLNVNVADLVFTKEGENYTVLVSSNTVDSFGNVDVSGDPTINGPGDVADEAADELSRFLAMLKELFEKIKTVLLFVGIGIVALMVVSTVLRFVKPKQRIEFVVSDGSKRKRRKRK